MRVAVVGTGISGLAAAWLLAPRHEVHLFEREARLGGHTNSIPVSGSGSPHRRLAVDTGFVVYNERTYPLLTRLFDELEVDAQPSDMSWSLRCERCNLEYASSLAGVAAQPQRLLDPAYLGMFVEISRFNRQGRRLVDDPGLGDISINDFLLRNGFSAGFRNHYLLPMASAIWSSGISAMDGFPMRMLLRFFDNHGLLGISTHHEWRTVAGGSSSYIPRMTARLGDRMHMGDAVAAVDRDLDGVTLRLESGSAHRFDAVVLAAHADESLGMLADPTRQEKEYLGSWDYSVNDTWLHTDQSYLPRSRRARASWNYWIEDCQVPNERVSLNYHMNRLQGLDAPQDYIVSLNSPRAPRPDLRLRRFTYRHPVFSSASVASQSHLDELNGKRRTFFAGAYQRYGFHEDGLWSAVRAVSHFGVRWPA